MNESGKQNIALADVAMFNGWNKFDAAFAYIYIPRWISCCVEGDANRLCI